MKRGMGRYIGFAASAAMLIFAAQPAAAVSIDLTSAGQTLLAPSATFTPVDGDGNAANFTLRGWSSIYKDRYDGSGPTYDIQTRIEDILLEGSPTLGGAPAGDLDGDGIVDEDQGKVPGSVFFDSKGVGVRHCKFDNCSANPDPDEDPFKDALGGSNGISGKGGHHDEELVFELGLTYLKP